LKELGRFRGLKIHPEALQTLTVKLLAYLKKGCLRHPRLLGRQAISSGVLMLVMTRGNGVLNHLYQMSGTLVTLLRPMRKNMR